VTVAVDRKLTVEQAPTQLDSRILAILRLYYLEELSVSEIAELPIGTVKSRLFYGPKLLANSLRESDE
jgi:DNA-directed RNA polymerase specialized sigma24 family protein